MSSPSIDDPYTAIVYTDDNLLVSLRINKSETITMSVFKNGLWDNKGNLAFQNDVNCKQQKLITKRVYVNIEEGGTSCPLSAPSVDGYTFLCWIGCSSSGWIGSPYIECYDSANCNVFDYTKQGGTVICCALYEKA